MKKIIVKEIDIKFDGDCIVSEYLVYYNVNGENLNAYIELGDYNKDKRIELIKSNKGAEIMVEYMPYENYIKQ